MGANKILVVDDESSFCDVMRDFLAGKGYRVDVATNGDQAVETYMEEKADVVLLDVRMPGKNGLETLRELKAIDPDVNAIMITAVLDRELYRLVMAEGALDYITKPLNFERLDLAIRTRLALRSLDR